MSTQNHPRRCRMCRCLLTEAEAHKSNRCEACANDPLEEERRGICEDREDGGHDTVSHMRRLRNGDPTVLAADLAWMGVTTTGDDVED
jgi:hypothetical protein